MDSFRVWNYLDWTAVFFQFGRRPGDEIAGRCDAQESLSGADVARDGMVPLVGARDGYRGLAVLHDFAAGGCGKCGASGADGPMDWRMVSGVDCGVRDYLCIADAVWRAAREWKGAGGSHCDRGGRGVVGDSGFECRAGVVERASGDQRWGRTGIRDAVQCMGNRVARAEADDPVDARECGEWRADSRKSSANDALCEYRVADGVLV